MKNKVPSTSKKFEKPNFHSYTILHKNARKRILVSDGCDEESRNEDHAQQWVTPINAALSVYAEVPPYCVEAAQTGHFPDSVDTRKLFQERRASLIEFFTLGSKAAACILCSKHTGECRQQQSSYGKIYRENKMCRSE